MSTVLQLLAEGEYLSTEQMGEVLGMAREDVITELERLQAEKILLGWIPVLHPEHESEEAVRAVIEVKISPEREGGFDRIAERIGKFDRVESCYLMSGAYDLLVVLRAQNLKRVASFVFEKLAPIEGVTSTATHFMLKAYKEQGHLLEHAKEEAAKPAISA